MKNEKQPSSLLVQALLCDDVRREFNGKQIIIGVYGDDVVLPNLPISIPLCLWMRFKFPASGAYPLELVVVGERQQRLLPIQPVQVNVTDSTKHMDVILGGILLSITEPETLKFQWRERSEESGEWKQVLIVKVTQGPMPLNSTPGATSVSQPPS
jgi:hypothetical protein